MAHKICGIDLGTHSVKASLFVSKLRQFRLVSYREVLLSEFRDETPEDAFPPPPPPAAEKPAPVDGTSSNDGDGEVPVEPVTTSDIITNAHKEAVKALLSDRTFKADTVLVALPGSATLVRYLSFPFSDPKKIAPVVGYELEGQIPFELDEVALDHMILETGRPAQGSETRVLVAAASHSLVKGFLDELESAGLDPHVATIAPVAYGFLGEEHPDGLTAVLDVGHEHTNICILRGKQPVFVRTLSRGGKHVTRAIAKRLDIDEVEAEHIKRREAHIPAGGEGLDARRQAVGEAVKKSMRLWNLGVRQSIAAATAELNGAPSSVVLCGGGSQLGGLNGHVAEVFGLPVAEVKRVGTSDLEGQGPEATLSYGMSHLGHHQRREVLNLRKGDLAPSSEMSLLREKALVFSVAAVVAFALLMFNGWAKLARLEKEERVLSNQLRRQTVEVLGKSMTNESRVLRRIRLLLRSKGGTTLPIPKSSAYAILSEISRKTPPSSKVTLDVRKLNIRSRKVTIKGTAASASEVEEFVTALKKIPCFKTVKPGTTTEVGSGEEKKSEFTINVESECM